MPARGRESVGARPLVFLFLLIPISSSPPALTRSHTCWLNGSDRTWSWIRETLRWVLCIETVDGRQIYFIANIGAHEKHIRGRFRVTGLFPWLFDAESGSVSPLNLYRVGDGFTQVELKLEAYGSAFVVFTSESVEPVEFTDLDCVLKVDGKAGEVWVRPQ